MNESEAPLPLGYYVLAGVAAIAFLLAPFPIVWKPWVSADYAAENLIVDNKGIFPWLPAAARSWGHRIYEPLFQRTNHFENLDRDQVIDALLEILSDRDQPDVSEVAKKLLASNNLNAKLLGCYAAERHTLRGVDAAACHQTIHGVLAQASTIENTTEMVTALRVTGRNQLGGMHREIARLALDRPGSFMVRVEACIAAAHVPEAKELQAALQNMDAPARADCDAELARTDRKGE